MFVINDEIDKFNKDMQSIFSMILFFYRKMVILGNWAKNRKEHHSWLKDAWCMIFLTLFAKIKKGSVCTPHFLQHCLICLSVQYTNSVIVCLWDAKEVFYIINRINLICLLQILLLTDLSWISSKNAKSTDEQIV